MKRVTRGNESGSSIVVVISILATLMVIVGVAIEYTASINRNVQRSNKLQAAIAIGDGCLDFMFSHWRTACRGQPTVAITTTDLQTIPVPTVTQYPNATMQASGLPNFTATANDYSTNSAAMVQQCKVIAVDPLFIPVDASTAPPPAIGPAAATADDAATTATFNYLATAYVTIPAVSGNLIAKVQRIFQKERASPWNWAIFYVDPLEIHPGPRFDVTGWVHTNSDLYTAHNTLWFQDKVTYAGDWNIGFKAGDSTHTSDIPAYPHYPANQKPQQDDPHQPTGIDSEQLFNTTDTNPNNDGYHELIEPPLNVVTNPDPLAAQRYYNQAGVIIELSGNSATSVTVTFKRPRGDGTAKTISSSSTGADLAIYNMFQDAVSTTAVSIQDNREASPSVRLTTLDVKKIVDYDDSTFNYDAFNGIVYINDTTGSSTVKRGIRLKNGSQIPPLGLTIASPNPVYIQGDYNTGSNPPSNSGTPTSPEGRMLNAAGKDIGAYSRAPCSVIADAVNLLSNSWNDAASGSKAAASATTYNTAIVSGIVPSGGGYYSGGAENFPRFLEDWSGKTLTYYGSMVELYQSKQAIGPWVYGGNIYEAPTRQWYFDQKFKIKPPPGTLTVYTYTKGRWSLAQ